jgi:transcription antitermination factor NusA-like protein
VADIRKVIEAEIQTHENQGTWRCAAVVKEARNLERIRVICRDESEVALVKEAAQKITVPGVRVLRDQLYPVRIDNANRTAVLDTEGKILPGAAKALGRENEVNIAKIA